MNALSSPLPREAPADDRERADDPEDRVERHGDRRDDQRQLEGVDRLGRRERVPGGAEAVLERAVEDDRRAARAGSRRGSRARRSAGATVAYARSCLVAKRRIAPTTSRIANEITSRTTATAAAPAGLPLSICAEDEDRRDLGLVRQVAGDDHERADLADRPGERERDAGEDPREDVREDRCGGRSSSSRGAERARRLLHLAVELDQHRLHGAHDERERHEQQRERRSPSA